MSPIVFIQGRDQVLLGSGNVLHSMIAGQEKVIFVAPADDYGMYDERNLLRVPRGVLPASCMLGLGQGSPCGVVKPARCIKLMWTKSDLATLFSTTISP